MLSVSLGPLAISMQLAVIYFTIIALWLLSWFFSRKQGASPSDALFNIVLLGFIGARVGFVLKYFDSYQSHLWQIIDIRDGGFLWIPGVVVGVLASIYHLWRKPAIRQSLGISLLTGVLLAGTGFAMVHAINDSQNLPDISLRTMQGEAINIQDYKGKPLVVNLWATWCPPCRREMPVLQKAQSQYPDIQFVFVNQGEGVQEVSRFLSGEGLELSHSLMDVHTITGAIVGSHALPTTLFYDAEGKLQNNHLGELSEASIKHALQSIKPATPK